MINYLDKTNINKGKWDSCINKAGNSLIYAYSYYLDIMTCHWGGLILNDYEAVMPFPFRKLWGIYYIYQPYLTAQLGLFGNNLNAELLQAFLNAIPGKFKYMEYDLNHSNLYNIPNFPLFERVNYILDLNKPYELLYRSYRDSIKRNIKKSKEYGCYSKKDFNVEMVMDLSNEYGQPINKDDIQRFRDLYNNLRNNGKAITYGIFNPEHQLMSSCVFLYSSKRWYYILVGNHPNGRTIGASHMLIDEFIQDNSGKDFLLDFEGSDMRNLAFFYSSFGAIEQKYATIRFNRLPLILKWLKK